MLCDLGPVAASLWAWFLAEGCQDQPPPAQPRLALPLPLPLPGSAPDSRAGPSHAEPRDRQRLGAPSHTEARSLQPLPPVPTG